jgi:cell wall assembly regulator SMI1
VDAWLAGHAPTVLEKLNPPASTAALEKLAAAARGPLPPGLVTMYQAHDGAKDDSAVLAAMRTPQDAQWVRYAFWLSAEGAVRELAMMRDLGDWPEGLVPFAVDAGGNLLVVELGSGRVLARDHEDGVGVELAPSMDAWISDLADDIKAGLVAAPNQDPDDEDFDDGRLMLLREPAPPQAIVGPPALAPDRAARVLIEELIERKFVEIAKGADLEPLVAKLHEALQNENGAERRELVIELLEESPIIDEIFADDDKIDGLVDALS